MNMILAAAAWWASRLWLLSWQAAVLIGVMWVISAACRRATPSFRYGLWCIVLIRLCLPFPLTVPWGVSGDVREVAVAGMAMMLPEATAPQPATPQPAAAQQPAAPVLQPLQTRALPLNVMALAGIAWAVLVLAILAIIAIRMRQARRLLAQCTQPARLDLRELGASLCARCGLARPVLILCFPDNAPPRGPAAIGVFHCVILLPRPMADGWELADLEPVLLHELAHVQRRDLLVNALQILVQAVYFFHPLVWYANSRIRRERELVCDDLAVLHAAGGRKRYSRSIVRVLEDMAQDKPMLEWARMGMTEQRSFLSKRIVRMMSHDYRMYRPVSWLATAALIVLSVAAIAVAGEGTPATPLFRTTPGGYTHLVVFEPVGDFTPRTPGELLKAFNDNVGGIKTGYFRTAPRNGILVGNICTDNPERLREALQGEPRLKWISVEPLTAGSFAAHSARTQESLPPADGGFAAPNGYTHLLVFEPSGGFAPHTPAELLDVFNGICNVKTGYFRTTAKDGILVGRICTDTPGELRKAMATEPRLKWVSEERLTADAFAAHEATKQESLP